MSNHISRWWQEAYGGYSSAVIWLFVAHSAQREVRERHHYTVDCVVAIYVGVLLWKMTGLVRGEKKMEKLEKLKRAAKDSDIELVRELLEEAELGTRDKERQSSAMMWLFAGATVVFSISIVLLAFTLTTDG